ncbi:MAG: peptide MFS transporter [Gemmatimonadaceae bacterium]
MKDKAFLGHPRGLALLFLVEMWERLSYYGMSGDETFYLGLGLVIIGTGFFKPNVSTMVGQLYEEGDPRRDGGFTLFYMGINLGGFLAPLVCGYLGERVGWNYGFGAAGIGMVLGLCLYLWGRERYLPGIGMHTAQPTPSSTVTKAKRSDDGSRITALAIVILFVIAFWSAFEQAGSSMSLFADKNTDRMVNGFLIPASWFQVINSGFILLLAPLFAILWRKLNARGIEPTTPAKMVFGLALLGVGLVLMVMGGRVSDTGVLVSPLWLVAAYFFHTTGELCLSPVGLSYVTKVAPLRLASFLMAAWFLANGAGNKIAGSLAALSGSMPSGRFYMIFVVSSFAAAAILWLLAPRINRLTESARV